MNTSNVLSTDTHLDAADATHSLGKAQSEAPAAARCPPPQQSVRALERHPASAAGQQVNTCLDSGSTASKEALDALQQT